MISTYLLPICWTWYVGNRCPQASRRCRPIHSPYGVLLAACSCSLLKTVRLGPAYLYSCSPVAVIASPSTAAVVVTGNDYVKRGSRNFVIKTRANKHLRPKPTRRDSVCRRVSSARNNLAPNEKIAGMWFPVSTAET